MKTRILNILFFLFALSSCEVNDDIRKITYRISDNESGFDVTYKNENDEMITENVNISSAEDVWEYSFQAQEGDIYYVSAIYKDINTGIKVQALIDGKVAGQNSSLYDTLHFVITSGTIPYEQ